VLGLRNSAHSLVKLMNPLAPVGRAPSWWAATRTPNTPQSMAATFALTGADALLLRGTEGEPVADPRRTPQMDVFLAGAAPRVQEAQVAARSPPCPSCRPASTPPRHRRLHPRRAGRPPARARPHRAAGGTHLASRLQMTHLEASA
jgi:hypothetical protein